MSSGPRGRADDPSAAPEDRLSSVDGSTVSPAERDASEPPPLAPEQRDAFVARVGAPLRVLALVMIAGLVGFAGWMVMMAWRMFIEGWTGRVPMEKLMIWSLLVGVFLLLPVIRRLWLAARSGIDPEPARDVIDAVESRAFLEAVERHDRLLEAQRLAAEEAGDARMEERGDPG